MYKANGSFQINVDCKWSSTADGLLGKHTAVDNELLLSLKMNRASFHLVLALKAAVGYRQEKGRFTVSKVKGINIALGIGLFQKG